MSPRNAKEVMTNRIVRHDTAMGHFTELMPQEERCGGRRRNGLEAKRGDTEDEMLLKNEVNYGEESS